MAVVVKRESGFVFEDDFSKGISPDWELVPYNFSRAVYANNKLNLRHGNSTVYLYLKQLQAMNEFVLDVKNDYNPTIEHDVGGITAFNSTNDFVALEEYYDVDKGTVESYPWLRLVKDHIYYSAYWSNDGIEWNFIGTDNLNGNNPKVGMFLEHNTGSELGIELVRVHKSDKVVVDNLQAGTIVSLVNRNGDTVSSLTCSDFDNKVVFNLVDLPSFFEAKFVIDIGTHVFDDDHYQTICGGDYYSFEITPTVVFVKDGEEYLLETHVEEFLGYTSQEEEYKEVEIFVRNLMPGTFTNVVLKLEEHAGTDHYKRLIVISEDSTAPVWKDTITIPKIDSGAEVKLLARLKRETDVLKFTPAIYFGLNVTATYSL